MSENKDFFISYNKADRQWAEWIAWHLEAENYTTVIQAWDFMPGSNFVEKMDQATKLAERTIAVLSPDFLEARFTQPEWAAAFAKDPTGEKRSLIPVLVRPCQLSGLLAQIVYVKLVDLDEEAAKIALIGGVKLERPKPPQAPAFPGKPKPEFPTSTQPVERSSFVLSDDERKKLISELYKTDAKILRSLSQKLKLSQMLLPADNAGIADWASCLITWAESASAEVQTGDKGLVTLKNALDEALGRP
jgi:TIR domain